MENKFRIISVERVDSYLDNTLAVICWGYDGSDLSGRRFEVTVDPSPNAKGLHEVWVGHRGRDRSYPLNDPIKISHVLEMVHQHIQIQIQRAEVFVEQGFKMAESLNKATQPTSNLLPDVQ